VENSLNYNQQQSAINIASVKVSGETVLITVSNNGAIYSTIPHFSFVINYVANVSGKPVQLASLYHYTPSSQLQPYQWTSSSPMKPKQLVNFTAYLPYKPYNNTQMTLVISTNFGSISYWRGYV